MRHFPVFLDLAGKKVVFSGAGETAEAKLRLLLKTDAAIHVFGEDATPAVRRLAETGRLRLAERPLGEGDVDGAALVYGANDDVEKDRRAVEIGKRAGALTNIVDNLDESEFITPAIVDRDPVTVAIGTEGTAPVLARQIKARIEELLPAATGTLAAIANRFRDRVARLDGRRRRDFWARFFDSEGPRAFASGGALAVEEKLTELVSQAALEATTSGTGHVAFVGAGPGDPELLTLKARRLLHEAEVVLHDALVTPEILELARREAVIVDVGKRGFAKSWKQDEINALLVEHAATGARVVRVKSGDPAIFGRLDEETEALAAAGIEFEIVPGITAASAAAGAIGVSLTRRGRNSALTLLTGHDMRGFAEQDWAKLAEPGQTAAIYMGLKAMRFIAGRLLMHGARADAPVTICANVSRADQQIIAARLDDLPALATGGSLKGPAVLLYGLWPHQAEAALSGDLAAKVELARLEAL